LSGLESLGFPFANNHYCNTNKFKH